MILRTILIVALSITLGGCPKFKVVGKTSDNMLVVKPTQKQIESAAREVVCSSFKPVYYRDRPDGPSDTPETIAQVRRNNAALEPYNCPKVKP